MKPVFSEDRVVSSMVLITAAHAALPHVAREYL
jgi:hypothetical protein